MILVQTTPTLLDVDMERKDSEMGKMRVLVQQRTKVLGQGLHRSQTLGSSEIRCHKNTNKRKQDLAVRVKGG